MPSYQDTRTTVVKEKAVVIERVKHSTQTTFSATSYVREVPDCGQSVTSVRTTRKPVEALPTELESRQFLFATDLDKVVRSETTRPRHFSTRMQRKIWELCNPNPCDMRKCTVTSERSNKVAILGVQQPKDPVWSWYDYIWEGDISKYVLLSRIPLKRFQTLSAESATYRNLAITKAYATAKSPVLPIQVYLGELTETLHMLRNPLGAIRKLFAKEYTSRSGLKPFKDLVETGAGTWLEFRYGWMPLVYQVEEIIDSFNSKINHGFPIHVVRGGSPLKVIENKQHVRGINVCAALQLDILEHTRSTIRAAAVLATRQRLSVDKFYGTRWSDLVSTAWEIKTLSFVWDWFFQIGAWLQAIVPDPDLRVLANSVSVKRAYQHKVAPITYRVSYLTKTPMHFSDSNDLFKEASYDESTLVREVNFKLPDVPVLRKQWLSLAKTADALSLTIGKIMNLRK